MKFKVISSEEAPSSLELDPKVLTALINSQLDDGMSGKKRVLACVVIPDYSGLLKCEIERAQLITGFKILKNNKRRVLNCIVPKAFINEGEYQKKMRNVEFLVDKEITKEQIGSQTAFMALDSLRSVLKLSSKLK